MKSGTKPEYRPEVFDWKDPVTKNTFKITIWMRFADDVVRLTGVDITGNEKYSISAEEYRRIPVHKLYVKALGHQLKAPILSVYKGSQRGHELSDQLLEDVAKVYREASNRRISPITAIAQAFNISKSTSAKRVMSARERGFLGKAVRGKAGEKK